MANHKSSKKKNPSDGDQARTQPLVPQDGPQRREGTACDDREERSRSTPAEGYVDARQAGQAQHHAQEQGRQPEERHPASRERTLILRDRRESAFKQKADFSKSAFFVRRSPALLSGGRNFPREEAAGSSGLAGMEVRPRIPGSARRAPCGCSLKTPPPRTYLAIRPGRRNTADCYLRASMTAAIRSKTSSIVPTPSTDAYLFCPA